MEPTSNIRHFCPEHSPKPNPEFADMPLEFFVGKYCKLAFPIKDGLPGITHEHMWVLCEEALEEDDRDPEVELYGRLRNDPFYATGWKHSDELLFCRAEIEEVRK